MYPQGLVEQPARNSLEHPRSFVVELESDLGEVGARVKQHLGGREQEFTRDGHQLAGIVCGQGRVPDDTASSGIGNESTVFLASLLPEIKLGRLANETLGLFHVLDAGYLHHDTVVPDPLHDGFRHPERVYAAPDYAYDAFHLGVGYDFSLRGESLVNKVSAALDVQPLPESFPVEARGLVRDQDHQGCNDEQADDYQA